MYKGFKDLFYAVWLILWQNFSIPREALLDALPSKGLKSRGSLLFGEVELMEI
jgi:hypothetical protein